MPENTLSSFETPWKIGNHIERWLIYPYLRGLFAWKGVRWDNGWQIFGAPLILNTVNPKFDLALVSTCVLHFVPTRSAQITA